MRSIHTALRVESLKMRRSAVPLVTALAFSLAPLVGGLFMFILEDPGRARRLGLIGQKAALIGGNADWAAYLGFLASAVTIGGFVLFAFVAAWVFGREFSDGTVRYLLALPTSRTTIVVAKLILIAVWAAILTAFVTLLGLAVGALLGLPGWSSQVALHGFGSIWAGAGLTLLVIAPLPLLAGLGRGYLAPLGVTMLVLVLAQVSAATGHGAYFPWAIPGLLTDAAGAQRGDLSVVSLAIVVLTGAIGVWATLAWWREADFSR